MEQTMSTDPDTHTKHTFGHLDFVASPVFVLKPDGAGVPRYVAFNANARAIARRPLADYLGQTAQTVYPGAFGLTAFERHCEVTRSGQPMTYQLELPLAGRNRSVRTTLIPQLDAQGHVAFLYGTSVDLTAEQANKEAQVSFHTITSEMEQFVAMAAHDLRAPLRNVAMIADMLNDGFVDHGDGKAELIDMLDTVAQKSMTLISDVLDHARAVDTADTNTKFNFAALCRDICDVLDPQNQHQFTYTTAELITDRTAMQIAIRNIIDNALKYGARESLSITITAQRGDGGMLDVIMTDSGHGFADGALKFLNGGAFRVDSGYGLLGVRRMVQARGGHLTACNLDDGSGTIIRFSLPGEWVGATNSLGDLLADWSKGPALHPTKTA